jgi:histone deacetylase 1/2
MNSNQFQSTQFSSEPNSSNRRVSYFYNPSFGKFSYSKDHPMKPERISMVHSLITTTGIYRKLNVYHAIYATKE